MIRFTTPDGVWHELTLPANNLSTAMRLFRFLVLTIDRRVAVLETMGAVFEQAFGQAPHSGTNIDVTDAFEARPFVAFGKTFGLDDEFELPENVVLFPKIDEDGSPKIIARCPDEVTAAFLRLAL